MTKPKNEPPSVMQNTAEPPELKGLRYAPVRTVGEVIEGDVAPELRGLRVIPAKPKGNDAE